MDFNDVNLFKSRHLSYILFTICHMFAVRIHDKYKF
jgi:hypothetical protein